MYNSYHCIVIAHACMHMYTHTHIQTYSHTDAFIKFVYSKVVATVCKCICTHTSTKCRLYATIQLLCKFGSVVIINDVCTKYKG